MLKKLMVILSKMVAESVEGYSFDSTKNEALRLIEQANKLKAYHYQAIEDITSKGSAWSVSRTDHNPESKDCIDCHSEEDAKRLVAWLEEINGEG